VDTVTCETPDCEMNGVVVDCTGMDEMFFDNVLCGVCGQPPRVARAPIPEPKQ
jgi:hypothetical protein